MKIKRFNESAITRDEIEEFIDELRGSLDYTIPEWIEFLCNKTKLKNKYKKINKKFLEENNLKKSIEHYNIEKQKNQLERQLRNLENKQEKLSIYSDSEIFYVFQEDLLKNDIENFYFYFLKDTIENYEHNKENYPENKEIILYYDIHPLILKKYKNIIDETVNIKQNTNKYNL